MRAWSGALGMLALGCSGPSGPDPTHAALAAWPQDVDALIAVCAQQPFEELAITCRVQAAAKLGGMGASERAREICALVPGGTWREECHFRAGEELGRGGHTVAALGHCRDAGWFGRNCLTHAGWSLPPDPTLTSALPAEQVEQAGQELMAQVDQALAGAPDGLEGEGRDMVMARWGYNLYVGTGHCDPGPARLAGPLGAAARTGFAVECARLAPSPSVDDVLAIWSGAAPPRTGTALPPERRMGRYSQPVLSPGEVGIPHLPVYGGGLRLVGQTPEEDVAIAALEALFWLPDTRAEAFLAWTDDPRERVRWTAAKLVRLVPAQGDLIPILEALSGHADENVAWHAKDGLDRRTWEVKGGGGGR